MAAVHHFKLVLLGDTAVGKSCLVVRFVRDEFFEFQEPTIGGKPLDVGESCEQEWEGRGVDGSEGTLRCRFDSF